MLQKWLGNKLYLSILDKSQMEKMQRTKTFNLMSIGEIEKIVTKNNFQKISIHHNGLYRCIEAEK